MLCLPRSDQALASGVCALLDALLLNVDLEHTALNELELESCVAFAVIWGCCGALRSTVSKRFGASATEARAEFSSWWHTTFRDKFEKYPEKGTLFDYCLELGTYRIHSWEEMVAKQERILVMALCSYGPGIVMTPYSYGPVIVMVRYSYGPE